VYRFRSDLRNTYISGEFQYFWGIRMVSEVKVKLSKKNTLYIPKFMTKGLKIKGGDTVKLRLEGSKIIIEPVQDPFDLAIKGSKFAKTTFEEFERESEELQDEIFKNA